MSVVIINPFNQEKLERHEDSLVDVFGNQFPIINGVPRFVQDDNYAQNFGLQWNTFDKTQLDTTEQKLSETRFFAETQWGKNALKGLNILEVGSGAGRFSKVILEQTEALLWSVDYSDAVSANFKNNAVIAKDRLHLFQASIYDLPFPADSFDKVFCLGVLQHTPDFEASVKALIEKAKPGGEIVVDFYPIKGWWTKIHAKYLLRPLTKKLSHQRLMSLIEKNIDWLIKLYWFLKRAKLGVLTRFLPIVDLENVVPENLSPIQIREWAILDTFDMFSPQYDNPQRIKDVAQMFERQGAHVTFAGFESFEGGEAAVVRGIKKIEGV